MILYDKVYYGFIQKEKIYFFRIYIYIYIDLVSGVGYLWCEEEKVKNKKIKK